MEANMVMMPSATSGMISFMSMARSFFHPSHSQGITNHSTAMTQR